jgi:hypothetical protein
MSQEYYDNDKIQTYLNSYIALYKKTYSTPRAKAKITQKARAIEKTIRYVLYTWYDVSDGIPDAFKMTEYVLKKNHPVIAKMMWLFWNSGITLDPNDLVNLAVKLNDTELSEDDYALLMFISYQGEDVTVLAKNGMPLSIFYDMYTPVAESNFEEWYKIQYVASGYKP